MIKFRSISQQTSCASYLCHSLLILDSRSRDTNCLRLSFSPLLVPFSFPARSRARLIHFPRFPLVRNRKLKVKKGKSGGEEDKVAHDQLINWLIARYRNGVMRGLSFPKFGDLSMKAHRYVTTAKSDNTMCSLLLSLRLFLSQTLSQRKTGNKNQETHCKNQAIL